MAHFAKLTEDGTQVLAVNVVDNSKILKMVLKMRLQDSYF